MKLKLQITRPQYEALITITRNLIGILKGEADHAGVIGFETYVQLEVLHDLLLRRLAPTVIMGKVKARQTISLTDIQTFVFWQLLNSYVFLFHPYEYSYGLLLIKQIDQQFRAERFRKQAMWCNVENPRIENY